MVTTYVFIRNKNYYYEVILKTPPFLQGCRKGGVLRITFIIVLFFLMHNYPFFQAMDRAHRIGQKKVVNVYRLVTRGTLEEKIMG